MTEKVTTVTLAVGDHVRLLTRDANQHASARIDDVQSAPVREPVDGLVLAIREISSGQLLPGITDADPAKYVIEVLRDTTFHNKFASARNVPRNVTERPMATPNWRRLRAALRDGAQQGKLYATAMPGLFVDSPLAKMLDGWKVLKVWSSQVVSLEKPAATQDAPAE